MKGVDTNVLVRFLIRDDERQAQIALEAIAKAVETGEALAISLLVLLETEWVLRSVYRFEKRSVIDVFTSLLESRDVRIESEEALEEALLHYESGGADFADCLFVAQYRTLGCETMLTFDARAGDVPGAERLA
ncbi:MAG TPA: type II toxin-antitoxin system VapC family toxin [Parvibaculum sp.]